MAQYKQVYVLKMKNKTEERIDPEVFHDYCNRHEIKRPMTDFKKRLEVLNQFLQEHFPTLGKAVDWSLDDELVS